MTAALMPPTLKGMRSLHKNRSFCTLRILSFARLAVVVLLVSNLLLHLRDSGSPIFGPAVTESRTATSSRGRREFLSEVEWTESSTTHVASVFQQFWWQRVKKTETSDLNTLADAEASFQNEPVVFSAGQEGHEQTDSDVSDFAESDSKPRQEVMQEWIDEQLAPYKSKSFTYADVVARKRKTGSTVHFIMDKDNITAITDGDARSKHWANWYRADQWQQMFKLLRKQKRIPDHLEIVVNIEASPRLLRSEESTDLPPVFSYCSTAEHYDLIGVGWQYHRCLSSKYHSEENCKIKWEPDVIEKQYPWRSRQGKALWRGSPTGGLYNKRNWKDKARSKLVFLSKDNQEILDAQFTKCADGQCTKDVREAIATELGYATRLANFTDYMEYKYLVDIDGESWSSRFLQLLASGATVFKQETAYREFSDIFFRDGIHYIKYAADLSDLIALLEGAKSRQEELEQMVDRSFQQVKQLVDEDVALEYMGMLLTSYNQLFTNNTSTVSVDNSTVSVEKTS